MHIRPFKADDTAAVYQLFYDTVHSVNLQHYTPEEVEAWVPSQAPDLQQWQERLLRQRTLLAEINGHLVGFANLEADGCNIDMVYTHKDFQGQGIATALVEQLEQEVKRNGGARIELAASITARPFFEKRGYQLIRVNEVRRYGIVLRNFIMEKRVE
ncbi:MAG: GNAT family N-acetyltransferase [Saprospiraceae bacterium]|nr:GNAT family N-acetyltransferase [Saprospiraceae bacterium]